MRERISENRTFCLIVGLIAGLIIANVWPHEPALAIATDRSSKFAMTTCTVSVLGTDPIEAVFVLDFLSGKLYGAVLSRQAGEFCTYYYRNVAEDFKLKGKEPQYGRLNGQGQLLNRQGITWATSVIYVGEFSTGKLICYGFPYREVNQKLPEPVEMIIIDYFPFRGGSNQNQ